MGIMEEEPNPLASLSLTHVYYDPNDHVSLVCAYFALLPQALCIVYATLILTTREAEIALTGIGQLACEVLNFALKRLIKEQRPPRINGKGYGMPSSHAQFTAFWSMSLALFLLVRHKPRPAPTTSNSSRGQPSTTNTLQTIVDGNRPWSLLERAALCVAGFVLAAITAWSRIYLGYHTTRQVMVGSLAGVLCALGWFVVIAGVRHFGLLSWALETPVARAFRVRDLVVEEDVSQAGWERWEQKRQLSIEMKRK